ncbi:MAG: HEAT repeat domain-containing protein [Verrucomicrobia bacterium]|nr:HEAT repeat domain-containing protein [Verrucomicrobiota bacterium]MBU4291051.1 HEAT repeat domain-containing protein [Verrucomicrobiota bacterium]MBU4498342.1 HEAT repeat domain-containing protein [Verrucomicrobiota bacterium]MCG2679447.1 HEAT repeat domain-containing protein [Kiritimatiellia bacterium]
MNRKQLQAEAEQVRRRTVELGEAGEVGAIPELLRFCRHAQPAVRRAAASALGKLSTSEGIRAAVPSLCELARDTHPQVRQYALLALGKIGEESALPVLRDAANDPAVPDYILGAALRAIEQIEAAVKSRQKCGPVACSRCGRDTTAEQRQLSERQFQRAYCGECFDAVFIERRNFDMKVQNQKTILAADRTVVQSKGERLIADWLSAHGIEYRYDDKFQIIQGFAVRPDFYLPRYDLYIEYWGLDTTDYKIGMLLKQKLYQQEGKKLVSLYPDDLTGLDTKLTKKLRP